MTTSTSASMNGAAGFSITENDKRNHEVLSGAFNMPHLNEFAKMPRDKFIKRLRGQVQYDIQCFKELRAALDEGALEVPYSYDELDQRIKRKRDAFCSVYRHHKRYVHEALAAAKPDMDAIKELYEEAEQNRDFKVVPVTTEVASPAEPGL